MPPAPLPSDEADRLAALHAYEVLDTDCENAFDSIARLAGRLSGCPVALISLVDANRQWFKARVGLAARETHRDQAFCAHAIIDQSHPLVVQDATMDARFADNPLVTDAPGIRFYAGVQLVNRDGHALGTLCVIDREPRTLAPEVLDNLVGLAQTVMTTLELRRALLQMQKMALTDQLSGLPNRSALMAALTQAIARHRRDGKPFGLAYIDLDHFKQVNDRLGHQAGDSVLTEAAAAIASCIRLGDMAARIGGDEFVALLLGGEGLEASLAGERIRSTIERRMSEAGWGVTASVGAVEFFRTPADEDEALAVADALMYAAKVSGKNCMRCSEFRLERMEPATV